MAVRRLAEEQPEFFEFTPENLEWAKRKIGDYPEGRQASAVIPILWRAQEQHHGWLPEPAIRLVADMLEMPYIRVLEIATFYTMFQLQPVGTVAHINVCGTTPCMLRGAEEIVAICKKRIAAHPFELSADGRFSWEEVECAGACVNAPMVQIGGETYEDLTPESFTRLLDAFGRGDTPAPGPQSARRTSEPLSGLTSLTEPVEPKKPSTGPAPDPDALPEQGVDPRTPEAAHQSVGRPGGDDVTEVEVSRMGASKPEDTQHGASEPTSNVVGHDSETEGLATHRSVDVIKEETPQQAQPETPASEAPSNEAPAAEPAAPAPQTADAAPEAADAAPQDAPEPPDAIAKARADSAGRRPHGMHREAVVQPDNLQLISGVGPVIERTLNELGIFTLAQIAAWDDQHRNWVNAYLAFKGRIDRERWVEQAQDLVNQSKNA